MIKPGKFKAAYVLCDFVAAHIAWCLFSTARYYMTIDIVTEHGFSSLWSFLTAPSLVAGQIIIPFFILFVSYLSGYYNGSVLKSRLQEFLTTGVLSFVASLVVFFTILINDAYQERLKNYELIIIMWGILFISQYFFRLTITNIVAGKVRTGEFEINTLLIGYSKYAIEFARKLIKAKDTMGYRIKGFVRLESDTYTNSNEWKLPVYEFNELDQLCQQEHIQTLIITTQSKNRNNTLNLINHLFRYNLPIKIHPELYDILLSRIRHANIIGEPLIDIAQSNMTECQKSVKRTLDIIISTMALVLLSPFLAVVALLIKHDSKGPVFYRQERIGKSGKPFYIYKFRTMVYNAESATPQLSSENDRRITKVGKTLRKYRIDEIPQFWNVIKGEMSIVGPRPERKYFADQIIEKAPYYALVYQVRPGITSWGMVKFGYATNVEEMIARAKYDLIYIENMSLLIDLKIIAYTVRTVVTGKGL